MFLLDSACEPLVQVFEWATYLVGTAMEPRDGKPPRDIDVRTIVDDKQYDRLQVIAGNNHGELGDIPSKYDYMSDLIKGDDYKQLSDIRKKEWLRQANKTYNQLAVDKLKQEDPSILSGMITNKTKEIAARNGISVGTP